MNSVFNEQILADKLSKLNNSQQSIETLSHWCIFHRKKAKQVVETWEKQFNNSLKEHRVPFLYLANDILQNSRRKGNEFVVEFWKVLPAALKYVIENGGDHGKVVVSRLVNIWEERKVFGSRGKNLKEDMLGKDPPPPLELNSKSSRSVRIVRRDPHSIKIKLAIGGTPEKIVSAFQSVHNEHANEETALNKCKTAVRRVGKMEKDVDNACVQGGDPQRTTLANELQEQETLLKQCIEQLETVESNRAALVSQLREALNDQESKLEHVRTQLQVAHAQSEQASNMRQCLLNGGVPVPTQARATSTPTNQPTSLTYLSPSTTTQKTPSEVAAEVAAKLAASTSSAQMLSSVLSSFAAEEAASSQPPEKRTKLDKPMPVPDSTGGTAYFTIQVPVIQGQTPPPQQPQHQQQQQQQHYVQAPMVPYAYATNLPPPPPPPLPTHMVGMVRPAPPGPPGSAMMHQHPRQPHMIGYYGHILSQPNGGIAPR
ncbi:regulation of nuclear pre-mRNA domain-containing protein 1B [Amborella trichopoda]|uniref:CID domain-containing protein n=1 Tax=Amborella trichopoda TaxID=13333 RepID=W1NFK2_AMBTC|nr:regulation of nuclear pre-mRNA domain-containing protein 1B [Amborella trichopoda]ERM94251.1 hypothetical protein AMTR_s00010p00218150 [Amborella trichopoda]|eukprot:XP_006827014.1 regulation of nuclear pre-mRNA domain-containing protein 1B [Amborella trichopoda]